MEMYDSVCPFGDGSLRWNSRLAAVDLCVDMCVDMYVDMYYLPSQPNEFPGAPCVSAIWNWHYQSC